MPNGDTKLRGPGKASRTSRAMSGDHDLPVPQPRLPGRGGGKLPSRILGRQVALLLLAGIGLAWWLYRPAPKWRTWPARTMPAGELRAAGLPHPAGTTVVRLLTKDGAKGVSYYVRIAMARPGEVSAPVIQVIPVLLPWRTAQFQDSLGLFALTPKPEGLLDRISDCDIALRLFDSAGNKIAASELLWDPTSQVNELAANGTARRAGKSIAPVDHWRLALDCRPRPAPAKVDWP